MMKKSLMPACSVSMMVLIFHDLAHAKSSGRSRKVPHGTLSLASSIHLVAKYAKENLICICLLPWLPFFASFAALREKVLYLR